MLQQDPAKAWQRAQIQGDVSFASVCELMNLEEDQPSRKKSRPPQVADGIRAPSIPEPSYGKKILEELPGIAEGLGPVPVQKARDPPIFVVWVIAIVC